MNQSVLLHIVERLEGLLGKLPAAIQKPILAELTPLERAVPATAPPAFRLRRLHQKARVGVGEGVFWAGRDERIYIGVSLGGVGCRRTRDHLRSGCARRQRFLGGAGAGGTRATTSRRDLLPGRARGGAARPQSRTSKPGCTASIGAARRRQTSWASHSRPRLPSRNRSAATAKRPCDEELASLLGEALKGKSQLIHLFRFGPGEASSSPGSGVDVAPGASVAE